MRFCAARELRQREGTASSLEPQEAAGRRPLFVCRVRLGAGMASQRVLASDSGARTVAAVPPLRRSQALHPPDVMVTGFAPTPQADATTAATAGPIARRRRGPLFLWLVWYRPSRPQQLRHKPMGPFALGIRPVASRRENLRSPGFLRWLEMRTNWRGDQPFRVNMWGPPSPVINSQATSVTSRTLPLSAILAYFVFWREICHPTLLDFATKSDMTGNRSSLAPARELG